MYREGRYAQALGFYTDALSLAKTNSQKIALHSNRAACFLKLHDFKKVTSLFIELHQTFVQFDLSNFELDALTFLISNG